MLCSVLSLKALITFMLVKEITYPPSDCCQLLFTQPSLFRLCRTCADNS